MRPAINEWRPKNSHIDGSVLPNEILFNFSPDQTIPKSSLRKEHNLEKVQLSKARISISGLQD